MLIPIFDGSDGIDLELRITPAHPPPPPGGGDFKGYDFLKAYKKCYKMSHVCTLTVGA